MSNESENKLARRVDDKRAEAPLNWSEGTQATAPVPALPIPVDVMIDIETLGTAPGSAILSIGAVVFGPEGLGDTFYAPVLLQSCVAAGLTIDPNTIAWWMQQSDEARAAAFRPDADALAEVLEQFTCWFGLVGAERPWCHGATFDVPLLEVAYKACGLRAPWRFYDVRDTRTLYDLAGVKVDRAKGTHHNALDDAIAQAEAAAKAMRILDVHKTIATTAGEQAEPAQIAPNMHPVQPLMKDQHGRLRFKRNTIIEFLANGRLNELSTMDFPQEDWEQLAQLIGYSLDGFGTLSYVTDETYERAASQSAPAAPEQVQAETLSDEWIRENLHCYFSHSGNRDHIMLADVEDIHNFARAIEAKLAATSAAAPAAPSLIEQAARAMAKHVGWDQWDTATDFCHTPSGNDPDDERAYWRDLARVALSFAAPAAPEQWISTAERMPEDGQTVRILCPDPTPEAWEAKWNAGSQTFESKANGWVRGDEVSHWMPKPAAPEQDEIALAMARRFLGWKLPKDFSPDSGISFTPYPDPLLWPIGTNLLNENQAKAMFQHCLRGAMRPTDDDLWDQTLRDRDRNAEWADKLADAIAKHFGAYIGEHSNMNCPWAEALEVIEGAKPATEQVQDEVRNQALCSESATDWAMKHACRDLPDNYEVSIELENGYGGVLWRERGGNWHAVEGDGDLADHINEAVERAIEASAMKTATNEGEQDADQA